MDSVKVGLLGLGNVGTGVYKILNLNKEDIINKAGCEIEISKILVKDIKKKRNVEVSKALLTTDFSEILNDDEISIVVEVIGGVTDAKRYIEDSIKKGKNIVTANKMLLAKYGDELFKLATDYGVNIYYEASVAGGIPIINAIKNSLSANKIEKVYGIVNGTTNYILSQMEAEKMTFLDALTEAQQKGYAEADPTSDIEGFDAQYKLAILAALIKDRKINVKDIYREGITSIRDRDIVNAKKYGYKIKLLAILKDYEDELQLRVHPALIDENHIFSNISGAFNGVLIKGNVVGDLMFYGSGAGELPTGSAVVSDIIETIKCKVNTKETKDNDLVSLEVEDINQLESKYYISFNIDGGEKVNKVKKSLEKYAEKIDLIEEDDYIEIVTITNKLEERSILDKIDELKKTNVIKSTNNILRIEEFE